TMNPLGSLHSIAGGNPESPGLIQYTCHFGDIFMSTPSVNGRPGSIVETSASNFAFSKSAAFGSAIAVGTKPESKAAAKIKIANRLCMILTINQPFGSGR